MSKLNTFKAAKYGSEFPDEYLLSDSIILYCYVNKKFIAIEQRFQVPLCFTN